MRHEDPNEIAKIVSNLVYASSFAKAFSHVDVGVSDFSDREEYLRILVHLKDLSALSEDDVDKITLSIEGAIAERDDRFPSVRFSES